MTTVRRVLRPALAIGALALLASAGFVFSQQQPVDPDLVPPPEWDVQTRGPVHEGFAQPIDAKTDMGIVVPKQPPAPIKEAPPEQRPDSATMQWIPGYWAWDADRNDFLWVSGVYREAPPARRFVPGHWVQDGQGWRWLPGFWAPENLQEVGFLPEPPAPLETAPAVPAPDPNAVYVSGYWVYSGGRYAWRAGYWAPHRVGRIWVSPRYVWTPSGYIFVDGYWDYPLEDRGVIFAPIVFTQPVYADVAYVYRPRFVVAVGGVVDACFYRPGSFHFYFGDYYGGAYVTLGYRPWWEHHHDPMFAYYRWHHRNDPVWVVNVQRVYADRMAGRLAPPPRTFAQLNVAVGGVGVRAVVPLKSAGAVGVVNVRLVANNQPHVYMAHAEKMRELAHARESIERSRVLGGTPTAPGAVNAAALRLPPPAVRSATTSTVGTGGTTTPAVGPNVGKLPVTGATTTTGPSTLVTPHPPMPMGPTTVVTPMPKGTTGPSATGTNRPMDPRLNGPSRTPPPPPKGSPGKDKDKG
jgi:hypothetical protein